jgi:hypothetical protein
MMVRKRDIDIEAIMTVHGKCDISCEAFDEEARFMFGHFRDGLRLEFEWPALEKFMRVAEKVIDQMRQIPRGERIEFTVCADGHSRKAHIPEAKQPDGVHVVK